MIEVKKTSNDEAIIDFDNNIIYIDNKTTWDTLDDAYLPCKIIQQYNQMTVIVEVNGYYFEINEKTIPEDFINSRKLQQEAYYINQASKEMKKAARRLKEENAKAVINKLYKRLHLGVPGTSLKLYITSYDQKILADKLYRLYRQNHNTQSIELLPPVMEVPKVMIKTNRQFN